MYPRHIAQRHESRYLNFRSDFAAQENSAGGLQLLPAVAEEQPGILLNAQSVHRPMIVQPRSWRADFGNIFPLWVQPQDLALMAAQLSDPPQDRKHPLILLTTETVSVELPWFRSYVRCHNETVDVVSTDYALMLREAGAVPAYLPSLPGDLARPLREAAMAELLARLQPNAIVYTGGLDIHPRFWGGPDDPRLELSTDDNVETLLDLYHSARGKIPILGICKGMQLILVAEGGRLLAHLPNHRGTGDHPVITHPLRVASDSRLFAGIAADGTAQITSYHHMGATTNMVPAALTVTAWHEADQIAEAVENSELKIYGIQGHPEKPELPQPGIIGNFLALR